MDEQAIIADLDNGVADSLVFDSDIAYFLIGYAMDENELCREDRAAHIESLGLSDIATKIITIRESLKTIFDDDTKILTDRLEANRLWSWMGGC